MRSRVRACLIQWLRKVFKRELMATVAMSLYSFRSDGLTNSIRPRRDAIQGIREDELNACFFAVAQVCSKLE
jgi:hypothetical protein